MTILISGKVILKTKVGQFLGAFLKCLSSGCKYDNESDRHREAVQK
jgi:hypothetical protein